jgi:hypothetical protein
MFSGSTVCQLLTPLLSITYYNQGGINIPIKHTDELGSHGEEIEFFVESSHLPIIGYNNRTANSNGSRD